MSIDTSLVRRGLQHYREDFQEPMGALIQMCADLGLERPKVTITTVQHDGTATNTVTVKIGHEDVGFESFTRNAQKSKKAQNAAAELACEFLEDNF